jgi:hypothetical protein
MKLDYGIDYQLGHALQPRITACGEHYHPMFPFGGAIIQMEGRKVQQRFSSFMCKLY